MNWWRDIKYKKKLYKASFNAILWIILFCLGVVYLSKHLNEAWGSVFIVLSLLFLLINIYQWLMWSDSMVWTSYRNRFKWWYSKKFSDIDNNLEYLMNDDYCILDYKRLLEYEYRDRKIEEN